MKAEAMRRHLSCIVGILSVMLVAAPAHPQAVKGGFIYSLSNFTGAIPYNHSRVSVDRERNEVYVLYQNHVKVFNASGMEIYQFGDDLDLGQIVDVAVEPDGDILLLTYKDSQPAIIRCNFRGEALARIELNNLPQQFSRAGFSPNRMIYQGESLYLASTGEMKVVVVDREGNYRRAYDLFALLELDEKERGNVEIGGFSVGKEGEILFTVPVLFTAYVLTPDGRVKSWGKPGGAPGRFNITGGIARDSRGNYLVVDKLKAAVQVFDAKFTFVTLFGSRGYKPGNLIYPEDIAIDAENRVYVTQMGKRGVSVWRLTYN